MLKIFISPCLLGEKVRYDGKVMPVDPLIFQWRAEGRLIALCPEVAGGLPVPRASAERVSANPLRIETQSGQDVTQAFVEGAAQAAEICRRHQVRFAILKSKSPSCGIGQIYNGEFKGKLSAADGVAARALREQGVRLFTECELQPLAKAIALAESTVVVASVNSKLQGQYLADLLGCELDPDTVADKSFIYQLSDKGLSLRSQLPGDEGVVQFDFLKGELKYRQQQISVKNEPLLRAIGFGRRERPSVLDCTAGMGRESFLMASAGLRVLSIERNPFIYVLLKDAFDRLLVAKDLDWRLQNGCAIAYLSSLALAEAPDVVYLDPMYPHAQAKNKDKSPVKLEMRVFRHLAGDDLDIHLLLKYALRAARKRVVLKRPDYAVPLDMDVQRTTVEMKRHRFDIYHVAR